MPMQVQRAAYGNCSKNYIDCRKHPNRTTSARTRYIQDWQDFQETVKNDHAAIETKIAEAEANPKSRRNTVARLEEKLKKHESEVIAVLPETAYNRWLDEQNKEIDRINAMPGQRSQSLFEGKVREIKLYREAFKRDITENIRVEMESTADEYPPVPEPSIDPFKARVMSVLANDGEAFTPNDSNWGDSRGQRNYEAENHISSFCAPGKIENYNEDYTFNLYDTYSNNDYQGISADIDCQCGKFKNVTYVMKGNMSTIFNKIMQD